MTQHTSVQDPVTGIDGRENFSWTAPSPWVRSTLVRNLLLRNVLPDREPSYVSSLLYSMGMLTLVSFLLVIASGVVLAVGGVQWWHNNSLGAFMNGIHFWSVQAFFLFMAVHALFNFFIMAWRGRRGSTWITGVLAFLLAILTAFTGFLIRHRRGPRLHRDRPPGADPAPRCGPVTGC